MLFRTPLTREGKFATYHLADEPFFKTLQENNPNNTPSLIINAARGGIINENALLSHLSQLSTFNFQLSNIAIDCWDGEPETNSELRQRALIATPHIAGYSADGKYNASQQVVEAVAKTLNIKPNTIEGLSEKKTTDKEGDELKDELLNNYNILADSDALKAEPEKFEHFRSNYPVRRELKIY